MEREKIPSSVLATVCSLVLILSIALPLFNDPGTLSNLDGSVGKMDHGSLWKSLDPISCMMYSIGDYTCHQMESRSLIINKNQLFLCIREYFLIIGVDLGALITVIIWPLIKRINSTILLILLFFTLLTIIEWYVEHTMDTNMPIIRALSSIISGFAGAFIIAKIIQLEYWLLKRDYRN